MEKVQVLELVINPIPGKSGVKTVASVDEPAIMQYATYFRTDGSPIQSEIKACFLNEEKGIILSPALIPDLLIPRVDPATKMPFCVFMKRETIFETGMNWMSENRQSLSNEMHTGGETPGGIKWFAAFFSFENLVPNPIPYSHLPYGTWYLMGKITDPELKTKFRTGEYKGISIEGLFDMINVGAADVQQIEAMTHDLLN